MGISRDFISLRAAQTAEMVQVTDAAFPAEETSLIANLVANLAQDHGTLRFGMVAQNELVGLVAFSPLQFADDGLQGFILSPLAVHPSVQRKGIGQTLVQKGLAVLKGKGADMVAVYGDPNYYGRFGFDPDCGTSFTPPFPLEYPSGWQAQMLTSRPKPNVALDFTCVDALSDPQYW